MSNIIVVLVAVAAAAVLFSGRLQLSITWQATVTPLASIIGSGFLVSVPLLAGEVGNWSTVAMAALVGAAYLVGAAIRFNIRYAEPLFDKDKPGTPPPLAESLEKLSHLVLAFAYFISVTYYLVLLSSFLLNGVGISDADLVNTITTAILAALGVLGLLKGLGMVERVEKYTVGVNLAVIAALIGGLFWYNGVALAGGSLHLGPVDKPFTLHSVQMLLGLLIVVQGFETSRFMGDEYDAETRIRTMRYAQWISAVIYLLFFLLMTILFPLLGRDKGITAIIGLVGHVALILPAMLTVGAIASQFSASVADSVGCAGLIEDIADKRISLRHAYPLIAIVAITIAWNANVFRIITLASQAFALFYLVQACVALSIVHDRRDLPNRTAQMLLFAAVALFCLCVVLFGVPSGG
jgi:small neutral amino acid transporter SnatA (MarC family)